MCPWNKEMKTPNSNEVMLQLFNKLKQAHSVKEIATKLGIHSNTVERWIKLNNVPNQYFYEFNRLLGNNDNTQIISKNGDKDKDQYFTKPKIAKHCFKVLKNIAKQLDIKLSNYRFIGPSIGYGEFYKLLPSKRRIGIDFDPKPVLPKDWNIIEKNFLNWTPSENYNYILIGNPPFGLRGQLALQFINHASSFCDMVAFILPPLFDSDGKGVPSKRVKGYTLAHTEKLPLNSYQYPNGKDVEVHTIFQVWTKVGLNKIQIKPKNSCKQFIKIYSLSDGGKPSNTRNKKMLNGCDIYLPSTCFKDMKSYKSFEELPNRRGYGIVIKKDKNKVKSLLSKTDWRDIAFKSTNSAINLRSSLIEEVLISAGFKD